MTTLFHHNDQIHELRRSSRQLYIVNVMVVWRGHDQHSRFDEGQCGMTADHSHLKYHNISYTTRNNVHITSHIALF